MDIDFFTRGMLIGFSIAAPVGPIGILCIRKSLQFGRRSGFVSGLGAAVADAFYGAVAAFGLTVISNFLLMGQSWLRWIGGIFLLYLGLKTLLSSPRETARSVSQTSLLSDFVSTFFITMTNPMTIFSYLAVFAGFGLSETGGTFSGATLIVVGVFVGSALWWLILSGGVGFFRSRMNLTWMKWINRLAGTIILGFGLALLFNILG